MASNFGKLLANKKSYLLNVYLLLAVQLAISALIVWLLRKNEQLYAQTQKLFILWVLLMFTIIIALTWWRQPMPVRLALFTVFSILLGIMSVAASKQVDPSAIQSALIGTVAIFIAMSFVGLGLAAAGVNLSFLTYVLLAALIGLIIAMIVVRFSSVSAAFVKAILVIAVVIFSVYVAYDTNLILQRNAPEDVVGDAIAFFLDIQNIFGNLAILSDS